MKKTLLIALAGMMLFAFAQCGGGTKGSKEYQKMCVFLEEIEEKVNNSTTCEDLEKVDDFIHNYDKPDLGPNSALTEEERLKLGEELDRILESYETKALQLCFE